MNDLFHEDISDHFIKNVFNIMSDCKQHVFQVLTKKSSRLNSLSKSFDPLISKIVDLDLCEINWVVVGGESGNNCREIKKEWIIDIKDYCLELKIPFFLSNDAEKIRKKMEICLMEKYTMICQEDKKLFESLYRKHFKKCYNYCLNLCKDPNLSYDILQDSFLSAYKHFDKFDKNKNFIPYIYVIIKNDFRSKKRKKIENVMLTKSMIYAIEDKKTNDLQIDNFFDYNNYIKNKSLLFAINKLIKNQRICLILKILFNYPHKEIAILLGKTHVAVRRLYFDSKINIKKRMEKYEKRNKRHSD